MVIATKAVHLTAMAHGGDAVGRYQGKVVFVPYTIPGEEVLVEITEERKRYARARLVKVLTPAPARVTPPCSHFGACGGCQWQHVAYLAQLEFKREIVLGQLAHLGEIRDAVVHPPIGMDEPWNYRNHVQFHLTAAGELGFQAVGSNQTVPIEECYLLHPLLEDILVALDLELPGMRTLSLRAGVHTGEQMLILETAEGEPPELAVDIPLSCVLLLPDGNSAVLVGSNYYHEILRGRKFRVSAPSFFQVNTVQAERLLEVVEKYLAPQGDETLLDLYCGVGTFGLSLAERVSRVIGIEESPSAIADARANAADLDNVTLIEGRVEEVLADLNPRRHTKAHEEIHSVVLDPPRGGCKPDVLAALAELAPARIVYISCNPAALARDARGLAERGYELKEVQIVDMFPQTSHTESVSGFISMRQV